MHQIIIIGSGPAGFTAAIYAARAGLEPLLFASSVEPGGELMNTTDVENFPGFPEGIQGPELMEKMQAQAERFGTKVAYDDVASLDLSGDVKKVTTSDGTVYETSSLIFATGSAYRKLGITDEERLSGHGVSWCATCDGFFFRDKTIAVVGGGDSAMEEATVLTRFAKKVYVIHGRGARARARGPLHRHRQRSAHRADSRSARPHERRHDRCRRPQLTNLSSRRLRCRRRH